MSFKPSISLPPVMFGSDPKAYHLQGVEFKKGDRRRTMSRSELQRMALCPRKWLRYATEVATNAMEWGSLVDMLVLTPELFDRTYAIAPRTYKVIGMQCPKCKSVTDSASCGKCKSIRSEITQDADWNWNAKVCSDWRDEQEQSGKVIVKQHLVTDARRAVNRLKEDDHISSIFAASQKQVQVNVDWHDETTGIVVPIRCMLDLVPDSTSEFGDTAWDFKTCENGHGLKWPRAVMTWQLHYQAALYLDALNAASGLKYRRFGHVIQESTEPFEPTHRILSEEFVGMGRQSYIADLELYCLCLQNNTWPGYDTAIVEPEAWMLKV